MWLLISLLAVCSAHWATGTEIIRSEYIINIKECNQSYNKLLNVQTISGHEDVRTVDLSGLKLYAIEVDAFDKLTSVESLNLNDNKLKNFNSSILSKMPNLRHISVAHNELTELGETFAQLDNLEKLDLSYNRIQNISETELRNFPKLTELIMKGNNIEYISNRKSESCSLEPERGYWAPGRVANWRIIPEDYKYNKNVNITELSAKQPYSYRLCKDADNVVVAVKLPTKEMPLKNCTHLPVDSKFPFKLSLHSCGIKGFAHGWYQISKPFFTIDLSGNDITEITPEILNDLPSHVTTVDLSRNKISTIKKDVIENRFLKALLLSRTGVSEIEDGAFEKTELDSLTLKNSYALKNLNFIKSLPASLTELILTCAHRYAVDEDLLSHLKALKVLTMDTCINGYLPMNIFRGLKDLEEIYLMRNNISNIELGTFDDNENLGWIFLSENNFQSLPSGLFKNIKDLKALDLTRNQFTKISQETFEDFKNKPVKSLWLHENRINYIEKGSFSNIKMEELNLGKNKLKSNSIAKGAFDSSTIHTLFLGGNLISSNGDIDGELFSNVSVDYLGLGATGMKILNRTVFGNMCKVRLDGNRIERMEGSSSVE